MKRWPTIGVVVMLSGAVAGLWWYRHQAGGTHRAPIGPDTIVMLGDSITEEGDWDRLLPGRPVSNRGHSGYTTAELVPVAEEVARAGPAIVFVLTGTNDIRDDHPPPWTVDHLGDLLDLFERSAPDTLVVVQTVLPRADAVAEVEATNRSIVELAAARGVPVLDLHPDFDDGSGGLRAGETNDGLHLTDAGYRRWADLLDRYLIEVAPPPRP